MVDMPPPLVSYSSKTKPNPFWLGVSCGLVVGIFLLIISHL